MESIRSASAIALNLLKSHTEAIRHIHLCSSGEWNRVQWRTKASSGRTMIRALELLKEWLHLSSQPIRVLVLHINCIEYLIARIHVNHCVSAVYLDFSKLKAQYRDILQLMPDEYEHSVAKLQSQFSDDHICNILSSSNCKVANNTLLNCLVEKLSIKEDLLDLCDQLEKVTSSHDMTAIISDIKSGM